MVRMEILWDVKINDQVKKKGGKFFSKTTLAFYSGYEVFYREQKKNAPERFVPVNKTR